MMQTAEDLAKTAAAALTLDPPPTEDQIDDVLARLSHVFGFDDQLREQARRILHARFRIRMELGQTLLSDDGHMPWLARRKADIDPFFWARYKEMLTLNGWSPFVIATLDQATDELLDLLGDPVSPGEWKRRGLVVGDVQSGKTASYAALICKAADAGYQMVILLTGMLENVRRQTQQRLDAAFVGLDSRDYLARGQLRRKAHVGVGLIDGRRDGMVLTSRDSDFRTATASGLTFSLDALREPVLVVTKKNKAVLQRLAGWLRARNADREGRLDVPLLLIDDEADNASINTRKDPSETTAINKGIRDLLRLFRRASYVGFTATPFANIFIDPASTDDMIGDDLFPESFIHVLEPPDNYVGMNQLFGGTDPETESSGGTEGTLSETVLRSIEDEDTWLPAAHKKDAEIDGLPESLKEAVRTFLVATAIRDLRALDGVPGRGGGIHRSMLVNVSRFTEVQNRVAAAISIELEDIRRAVRLHGGLPPAAAASQSEHVVALQRTFQAEFSDDTVGWPRVLKALHEAIAPVVVRAVNQGTGAASLDYSPFEEPPGLRVIAVGGNSLSRGLTLEGLSTSYFLRNSKTYDTLLQMGRWFGYRDGYGDLCRVWLTADAEGWYRHITDATGELKRDFARMKRRQATPREFGLRVRTHPDTLLITARNKMATGIDVVGEVRDISLWGRGIESSRLYSDERRNRENFSRLDRFLLQLDGIGIPQIESPHGGAVIWTKVPVKEVADFLESFLVHPLNHDFQADSIAEFLRSSQKDNGERLEQWNIALMTRGRGEPVTLPSLPALKCAATTRRVDIDDSRTSLLVSGRKARVGGRADLRHGLAKDQMDRLVSEKNGSRADIHEDDYRRTFGSPLMLVYLVQGFDKDGQDYKRGLILPALALHFPGTKDEAAPKKYVKYRLNKVAQTEMFPVDVDDDDLAGDPDDPD